MELGQKRAPSAAAILELNYAPSGTRYYYVKYLKRFHLNTTYTDIAIKLASICRQLKAFAEGSGKTPDITFSIDATGVGEGVAEVIESKIPLAEIYRVYLTAGINASVDFDTRQIRPPKAQLVSTLLAAFDSDRIYLSKQSKELDAILDELQNFEIKISDEGRDSYGAKIGAHDDLIVSLGLPAWTAEQSGEPIKMW